MASDVFPDPGSPVNVTRGAESDDLARAIAFDPTMAPSHAVSRSTDSSFDGSDASAGFAHRSIDARRSHAGQSSSASDCTNVDEHCGQDRRRHWRHGTTWHATACSSAAFARCARLASNEPISSWTGLGPSGSPEASGDPVTARESISSSSVMSPLSSTERLGRTVAW